MRRPILLASAVLLSCIMPCPAQSAVRRIALGDAVDTAVQPVGAIVRTVIAYWHLANPGTMPTPLWVASEQRPGALYDLSARDLYGEAIRAIIVGVDAATPDSTLFVIKTLFANVDSTSMRVEPVALQRLYAQRSGPGNSSPYGWQLSGAISHLTATWAVHRVGDLRYHVFPGLTFSRARADSAYGFVITTARCLGVVPPATIDYYVTPSWEEVDRLVGLDWGLSGTAFAGRAYPAERVLLAGNPRFGEAFTHELAHIVLAAVGSAYERNRLVEEGVATWLGGGNRGTVAGYYALLHAYQLSHRAMTFSEIVHRFDVEAEFYATGALLAGDVYQRGGLSGLRQLLAIRPDDDATLSALPRLLGIGAQDLDKWWRDSVEHPPKACR